MKELVRLKTPEDTASLPDLPGLEEVISKNTPLLVLGVLFALLCVYHTHLIYKHFGHIDMSPRLLVIFVLSLILTIYPWYRMFTGHFFYSTNSSGIGLNGFVLKQFIPWAEVKSIKLFPYYGKLSLFVTIETIDTKYIIEPAPVILASIWQHLRRIGKADRFILPEQSLSLWAEITDEVPDEYKWIYPKNWKLLQILIIIVVNIVIIVLPIFSKPYSANPSLIFDACRIFLFITASVYFIMQMKQKIIISDGSIEIFWQNRSEKIYWNEIISAQASQDGIIIKTKVANKQKRINIQYFQADKNGIVLILALIKKIKNIEHITPVSIPARVIENMKK